MTKQSRIAPASVPLVPANTGAEATPITATDALANNSVRDTGAAVSPLAASPTPSEPCERAQALRDRAELIDGTIRLRSNGKPVSLRPDKDGYLTFTLDWGGKTRYFAAARAIWFLHYGAWPAGEIDHINGVRSDNRIENLQDVPRDENNRLRLERVPFRTGKGVYFKQDQNIWRAEIYVGGVRHDLGRHKTQEAALAARLEAERRFLEAPVPVAPTLSEIGAGRDGSPNPCVTSKAVPSYPTGGAGAPNASPLIMHDGHAYDPKRHGTNPCLECLRGEAGCICGVPEPEQECFVPGLNRDPDWYRVEL